MENLCFSIPEDTAYLSFRSLIPFFIRPKKESYVDCKKPGKTGSEYQTLLYNSFLLGLDINLVEKKYKLRKEQGVSEIIFVLWLKHFIHRALLV
jgi:uncharacterized protein YydD (DUF2326 family)